MLNGPIPNEIPNGYEHVPCRAIIQRTLRDMGAAWEEGKSAATRERDEYARRWREECADHQATLHENVELYRRLRSERRSWHARLGRDVARLGRWLRRYTAA